MSPNPLPQTPTAHLFSGLSHPSVLLFLPLVGFGSVYWYELAYLAFFGVAATHIEISLSTAVNYSIIVTATVVGLVGVAFVNMRTARRVIDDPTKLRAYYSLIFGSILSCAGAVVVASILEGTGLRRALYGMGVGASFQIIAFLLALIVARVQVNRPTITAPGWALPALMLFGAAFAGALSAGAGFLSAAVLTENSVVDAADTRSVLIRRYGETYLFRQQADDGSFIGPTIALKMPEGKALKLLTRRTDPVPGPSDPGPAPFGVPPIGVKITAQTVPAVDRSDEVPKDGSSVAPPGAPLPSIEPGQP